MSFGSSTVIIAKSKAIYSTTLKEKALFMLSEKTSIPDFVLGLKSLPQFADTFSSIPEQLIRRAQLEDLLRKISYRQVLRIVRFATGKSKPFYYQKLMVLEIDYLLSLYRFFLSDLEDRIKPIDDIPTFVHKFTKLPLRMLAGIQSIESLNQILLTTPYRKVIEPFLGESKDSLSFAKLEFAFYVFQYDVIFDMINRFFSGQVRKNLLMMYQTKLDLENIAKIYRLKKFYQASKDAISDVLLLTYSNVKKSFWNEILAIEDPEMVLTAFTASSFSKIKDQQDYVFIEFDIDKIKYNLAKRFLYYSINAAEVFTAFTILEEIEQINLTNIIEGIRYNLESKKIQRMLIY